MYVLCLCFVQLKLIMNEKATLSASRPFWTEKQRGIQVQLFFLWKSMSFLLKLIFYIENSLILDYACSSVQKYNYFFDFSLISNFD